MWRINNSLFTQEQQSNAITQLVTSTKQERGPMADQVLDCFKTADALRSSGVLHVVIDHSLRNAHYDSSFIEDLNSQTAHANVQRIKGYIMEYFFII